MITLVTRVDYYDGDAWLAIYAYVTTRSPGHAVYLPGLLHVFRRNTIDASRFPEDDKYRANAFAAADLAPMRARRCRLARDALAVSRSPAGKMTGGQMAITSGLRECCLDTGSIEYRQHRLLAVGAIARYLSAGRRSLSAISRHDYSAAK